jgi:hypothetical protein
MLGKSFNFKNCRPFFAACHHLPIKLLIKVDNHVCQEVDVIVDRIQSSLLPLMDVKKQIVDMSSFAKSVVEFVRYEIFDIFCEEMFVVVGVAIVVLVF